MIKPILLVDRLERDVFLWMFDINGDGHTDIGEEFMAYQIYEDMTEKKTDSVLDCGCNLLMID